MRVFVRARPHVCGFMQVSMCVCLFDSLVCLSGLSVCQSVFVHLFKVQVMNPLFQRKFRHCMGSKEKADIVFTTPLMAL